MNSLGQERGQARHALPAVEHDLDLGVAARQRVPDHDEIGVRRHVAPPRTASAPGCPSASSCVGHRRVDVLVRARDLVPALAQQPGAARPWPCPRWPDRWIFIRPTPPGPRSVRSSAVAAQTRAHAQGQRDVGPGDVAAGRPKARSVMSSPDSASPDDVLQREVRRSRRVAALHVAEGDRADAVETARRPELSAASGRCWCGVSSTSSMKRTVPSPVGPQRPGRARGRGQDGEAAAAQPPLPFAVAQRSSEVAGLRLASGHRAALQDAPATRLVVGAERELRRPSGPWKRARPSPVEDEVQARDVAVADERRRPRARIPVRRGGTELAAARAAARAEMPAHLVVREEAAQLGEPLRGRARGVDVALGDGVRPPSREIPADSRRGDRRAAGAPRSTAPAGAQTPTRSPRAGRARPVQPLRAARRVAPPSTAIVVPGDERRPRSEQRNATTARQLLRLRDAAERHGLRQVREHLGRRDAHRLARASATSSRRSVRV